MTPPEREAFEHRKQENLEALVFTMLQKGEVNRLLPLDYISQLPISGNNIDDMVTVLEDGFVRIWDGTQWLIPSDNIIFVDGGISETISPLNGSVYKQTAFIITTTLPLSPVVGNNFYVVNRSGGTNIINGNGSNIDGNATVSIIDGESFFLTFDGTGWMVI